MESPIVKAFLAGSLSGTCSAVLFQPLDLVKTRLQQSGNRVGHEAGRSEMMLATINQVIKNDNILGLWRGMVPSIARCVPGVGVYFGSLHWLKSSLLEPGRNPSPIEAMALGIVARSISGVIMIPITVVKTRVESGVFGYSGVTAAIKSIYKTEGVKGLCSGLSATLLRDAPFSGIYLFFYTQTKQLVPNNIKDTAWGPSVNFSCGVVSGVLASSVTQPADVIKTKMQLYPRNFPTTYATVMFIYQNEGTRGFFKGLVPRMLRRTMISALAWTVYEQITKRVGLK